jgi:ABC-type Fe3+/spermidine/putrescine transport system ATPase subunit
VDDTKSNSQAPAVTVPPVKLDLAGVSKIYSSGTQALEALEPVDIQIRAGEFVVFFGPSGCGKSTLLNIIAGFEDVTGGFIGRIPVKPHHDRLCCSRNSLFG